MPVIRFETKLFKIGSWTILRLPKTASAKLASRGQVMVVATIDGFKFRTALEPDGSGSHWFKVSTSLQNSASIVTGQEVTVTIEPTKELPEPIIPTDLMIALDASPRARTLWSVVTPMARWEWIRWIRATNRQGKRVLVESR